MEARWWYVFCIRYQLWSSSMAASTSKEALMQTMEAIIADLELEGLVDKYFRMSEQLKRVNGPYFFANLLPTFINDTRNAIRDLTKLLEETTVNFHAVEQLAIKLRGSCSCIGMCGMAAACATLREASQNKNQEECTKAVNEIKDEFGKVHARLDAIVQLERQIIRLN